MRFVKKNSFFYALYHTILTYPAPSNFSYWWNFGVLAFVCLLLQILTGIFLAMHYTPHADLAFTSVEHIMRDVSFWLVIFVTFTLNGASFFFIVVYAHHISWTFITHHIQYIVLRYFLWQLGHYILLND